jgi:putative membrane protein
MLQHVLVGDAAPGLALVALRGPLLFFFLPRALLRKISRPRWVRQLLGFLLRPRVVFAAWIVVIGAWHVPAVYDFALGHQTVHDLEHLSFIVVGLLVWAQIVDPGRRHRLSLSQRVGYMLALFGAGSVFAAGVLVFSPTPLYPAYAGGGARLFALSPLRDQQLAGLVMVVEQFAAFGLCAWFSLRGSWSFAVRRGLAAPQAPSIRGRTAQGTTRPWCTRYRRRDSGSPTPAPLGRRSVGLAGARASCRIPSRGAPSRLP